VVWRLRVADFVVVGEGGKKIVRVCDGDGDDEGESTDLAGERSGGAAISPVDFGCYTVATGVEAWSPNFFLNNQFKIY